MRFWRENFHTPGARYMFRATDEIYALGVALYEVLTGRPPFSLELPWEVLNLQIECRMPPPPASFDPRIPPAVSALVMRLLAKRPEDRPQSGQQVHQALQEVMRHGGLRAGGPGARAHAGPDHHGRIGPWAGLTCGAPPCRRDAPSLAAPAPP